MANEEETSIDKIRKQNIKTAVLEAKTSSGQIDAMSSISVKDVEHLDKSTNSLSRALAADPNIKLTGLLDNTVETLPTKYLDQMKSASNISGALAAGPRIKLTGLLDNTVESLSSRYLDQMKSVSSISGTLATDSRVKLTGLLDNTVESLSSRYLDQMKSVSSISGTLAAGSRVKLTGLLDNAVESLSSRYLDQMRSVSSISGTLAADPRVKLTGLLDYAVESLSSRYLDQMRSVSSISGTLAADPRVKLTGLLDNAVESLSSRYLDQMKSVSSISGTLAADPRVKLTGLLDNAVESLSSRYLDQMKSISNLSEILAANPEFDLSTSLGRAINTKSETQDSSSQISESKVEEDFSKLIQEMENSTNRNTLDWINRLSALIIAFPGKLKRDQPALYLLTIVVFLQLVLVPLLQDSAKATVFNFIKKEEHSPNEHIKDIKLTLSNETEVQYTKEIINAVRVTNRGTTVYHSNYKKSGAIDTITENRPVIILNKKKNWSKILYTNQDNEEVTGWVFTGNLEK